MARALCSPRSPKGVLLFKKLAVGKIRTIKPSFFEDEKLGKLPVPARLLYIGTWTLADDNGVFKGHPAYLKSQIFPYDDTLRVGEVSKWIDALVDARTVIPFCKDGESYYVIRTFRSHQKTDPRYPSELIPSELVDEILGKNLSPACPQCVPSVSPMGPQCVPSVGSGGGIGGDSHTQEKYSRKNSHGRTREEGGSDLYDVMCGAWLDGFAPNLRFFKHQVTKKQFSILLRDYYPEDVARLMFAISAKTDPAKLSSEASVYATICTYAANDTRIQEQREARAHNANLSAEGLANGYAQKKAIPRTTRVSNPELGYIFDSIMAAGKL